MYTFYFFWQGGFYHVSTCQSALWTAWSSIWIVSVMLGKFLGFCCIILIQYLKTMELAYRHSEWTNVYSKNPDKLQRSFWKNCLNSRYGFGILYLIQLSQNYTYHYDMILSMDRLSPFRIEVNWWIQVAKIIFKKLSNSRYGFGILFHDSVISELYLAIETWFSSCLSFWMEV